MERAVLIQAVVKGALTLCEHGPIDGYEASRSAGQLFSFLFHAGRRMYRLPKAECQKKRAPHRWSHVKLWPCAG